MCFVNMILGWLMDTVEGIWLLEREKKIWGENGTMDNYPLDQ